ncbi:TonB-dependent receptor plug domain-containing protein [Bradyrhizobium ottawaense]
MVVAGQTRKPLHGGLRAIDEGLSGMRRAGGDKTVARFGAALLGGVAWLTWFESPAQSQTPQGGSSLPPVTVEAPTQQSVRRAPTRRNDARVRSTSRRAPQAPTVAVQSQPAVVPPFAGGQVAQGARLGMLGNTNTMKSPFSVTSYTDKFIRDQQAATGADALILDPSVRSSHPTGGIVDSFNIRGFPINEGNNGEFAFTESRRHIGSSRTTSSASKCSGVPRPRSRAWRPMAVLAASSMSCPSARKRI